jgi:hypothetical protein
MRALGFRYDEAFRYDEGYGLGFLLTLHSFVLRLLSSTLCLLKFALDCFCSAFNTLSDAPAFACLVRSVFGNAKPKEKQIVRHKEASEKKIEGRP